MLLHEVHRYLDDSLSSHTGSTPYSNQPLPFQVKGSTFTNKIDSNDSGRSSISLLGEYQPKAVSPETKSIIEHSYGDLRLLPPGYSRAYETYRRIAELGAGNETYRYASEWIDRLKEVVLSNQMWWSEPLVNLSMESEVVFEWWRKEKSLAVYILGDVAQFIKAWGEDIDNEMEDGLAKSPEELTELWKWLIS